MRRATWDVPHRTSTPRPFTVVEADFDDVYVNQLIERIQPMLGAESPAAAAQSSSQVSF
jgi:hypothetical protein